MVALPQDQLQFPWYSVLPSRLSHMLIVRMLSVGLPCIPWTAAAVAWQ